MQKGKLIGAEKTTKEIQQEWEKAVGVCVNIPKKEESRSGTKRGIRNDGGLTLDFWEVDREENVGQKCNRGK